MEVIMEVGSLIPLWKSTCDVGVIKCKLSYDLELHKTPISPTSSESDLELNLWTERSEPHQTLYALNGVDQGYLPRHGYWGRCAILTSHSSIWFLVASSLGFEIASAWKSNTEFASDMTSIFPKTRFGYQLKHAKGVDILMGDIESLSTYPHYCKSVLVPNLRIGKINRPDQLAQGGIFHQEGFCHPDLGGITDEEHSLLLLTHPAMLLQPCTYEDITR